MPTTNFQTGGPWMLSADSIPLVTMSATNRGSNAGPPATRRAVLVSSLTGITAALAGCNSDNDNDDPEPATETPTTTLVVPSNQTTTVSPTPTPTVAATPTATRTDSATPTATTASTPPPADGGESGGGSSPPSDSTATPTPTATATKTATATATPADELVIPSGESHSEDSVPTYSAVEWHDTGRLILQDGAGFQLTDMEKA